MPYRRLPERDRARETFDRTMARRMSRLERRSRYPGARRIAEGASIKINTGTARTYLSMNVDIGAWVVSAGFNYTSLTNNAVESCDAKVLVYDRATGAFEPAIGPPAAWSMRGVAGGGVRQPFTLFGHGHWDQPVRLELWIACLTVGTNHKVTLTDLCLQVVPT